MLNNGMMKYRQEESKRKKEADKLTNVTLPSIKGTASSGQRPRIPTIEEKVAEQMRSATKPTQSQRVTNVGTRINGAMPSSMLTPAQRDARNTETLHNTATSEGFRVASGIAAGLSPLGTKAATDKEKQIQDIRNASGAYKAGKVVGELGAFAIPYAGAAGKVRKVVSKVPQVAKMGTVGQNVAKSIATDLAIGAPLNVNYAFNKEGLRGKEAAKSIALNIGMDLVLGGAIEVATTAVKKFAKDLSERLGRTVTDEEAFDILQEKKREYIATNKDISEEEREKLLRELAEESNRRKGKSVANTEVLYGNSTRMPVADLPEPKGNKTGLYQMEGDYGVDLKGELPTPNELMAKQLRQIEGPRNITRATKEDFEKFVKGGSEESSVGKIRAQRKGNLVLLEKDDEIDKFIIDSLERKITRPAMRAVYGKVPKRFADEVYRLSGGECDIYDKIVELPSNDLQHSFDEHSVAKQEGDIPLDMRHWLKIPEYLENYTDVIEVVPIESGFRIKVGKRINGYSVMSEIIQTNRDGLTFKNMWGNSTEKYLAEKAKARRYAVGSTAKNAHKPSDGFSDGALDNNIGDSAQNVNTSSPKIEPILPVEEMVERQMKGKKPLKEMGKLGKLYSLFVDNLHGVGRTSEGAKILSSNVRKAEGTSAYIAKNGMVDMSGRSIAKKRPDGKAVTLENIFNQAADVDLDAFTDYLLHRHNIDRARQGKNVFNDVSAAESKQKCEEILMQYPEFKLLGDELSEINEQLIDNWLVPSGLIDEFTAKKLKALYPNYVPTYRIEDEAVENALEKREAMLKREGYNSKTVRANTIVHEATGGNKPVIAPNVSLAVMLKKVVRAARMNELAVLLRNEIMKNPEKFRNVARMADDTNINKYGDTVAKNMMDSLESKGLEGLDDATDQLIGINKAGQYYVVAMVNGKPSRMIVNKDIYDGLTALCNVKDDNKAVEIYKFMTNATTQPFKALITGYNPFFGVRNILRDIPTAYIQGTEHNPVKFVENQIQAYHDILTNAPLWQQYQAIGGKRSGYFNTQKGFIEEKGLAGGAKKFINKLLDGVALFNETTEAATRYAEFLGTLKRSGKLDDPMYEDLQRALYNSGEVTVDFLKGGDVTKAVDRLVPYLNPAVQGIDKFLRTMTTSPAAWVKGFTALTIPSIGLYEYNQRFHKEDYDKLDDRTKDNYYVFYIPDSDGKFIKIPKSRESGVLFQALAERLLRMNAGDEDAFKNFWNKEGAVATNFAPQNPLENNIFSPVIYNLPRNKDFAGRTIVPQRLEGYYKSEQYDERTSEVAKWLGSAAAKLGINDGEGLSPKQIDYIIDSYTGIIGDILIPATTQGGDVVKKVITGPFTVDNVYSNSIQNDFYEGMEKAEKEKNHINLQDDVNPDWKTPEEYRYSVYTKAQKEMGELRKIERKYQQLPASETRDLYLRELRKQINSIAETATSEVDKLTADYRKNYIPALSDMNEKKQTYYRENLKGLGVDPAELRNVYDALDLNGSGSISQDEAYTMLEQTNFSREQKAAIWNFINSSWKKNPYI